MPDRNERENFSSEDGQSASDAIPNITVYNNQLHYLKY